jgi:hypothetical protein
MRRGNAEGLARFQKETRLPWWTPGFGVCGTLRRGASLDRETLHRREAPGLTRRGIPLLAGRTNLLMRLMFRWGEASAGECEPDDLGFLSNKEDSQETTIPKER